MKEAVLKQHPNAYATYGIQLFTNKRLWRIEDGSGKVLANKANSESDAWKSANKLITSHPKK